MLNGSAKKAKRVTAHISVNRKDGAVWPPETGKRGTLKYTDL